MPRILARAGVVVALFAPTFALAAATDVTLTTNTVLTVAGITLNVSGSSAVIESITVNSGNFSVTMSSGSSFQVTAPGLEQINADTATGQASFICNNSQSLIKYVPTSALTVTITPNATLCSSTSSGGGGSTGGGGSATVSTTPTTTTATTTTTTTATTTTTTTATTTTVPAVASSGLSASQIQSILDVLASFSVDAATMSSVRLALEGTPTTGSVTSNAVRVFKANLTVGSLGSEVKALQEYLNANGFRVSASGAGSPGKETTRFGSATKAALIKYQKAKGITPAAGYFGAKTRTAVNAGS